MPGTGEVHYPDDFVARLHAVWGEGFLSPGGPEEVREIVRGLDLSNSRVLDIGSGTGGPAIVLGRDCGARVVGIDIEPQLVARAQSAAVRAGASHSIEFRCVEPGAFSFDDATFDVVFSKDALIHVPDKPALYREALRVLKPGGMFAASDWLCSASAADDPRFQEFLDLMDLGFEMATAAETERIMRDAGFADVSSRDRNEWYVSVARDDRDRWAGPLREEIVEHFGEEVHAAALARRQSLVDVAEAGLLRPTHLRGRRR